ncbi:22293_t:CDS:1, partial [Racocetra persica]
FLLTIQITVTIHDKGSNNYWTSKNNYVELESGSSDETQNWTIINDSDDTTVIYITQDIDANKAITYDPNTSNKFLLKAYNPGDKSQQFVVNPQKTDTLVSISCASNSSYYAVAKSGDIKDSKIGPGTSDSKQWMIDTTV